jgi:chromosome segregation protein
VHLRSITLRGFKSFADRTTLELDPGLIGIVGPNGAGKSNLIDALIWSLGTLSHRSLRAEKMEDVIFTGTEQRKALGMAQVTLTLDNTDGAFPIDFSEVQISRTLFRDGASEYAINGTSCRLLDVQELLAEAGLGREMHAVVAQGQVDDIVQSKPEDLRAYVEEAAGIAKHRRRKDRALRKIEQVSQDIDRAADIAGELRRQLRPLRAQAEQARRHTEITERLREIRIRRAVGELEALERDRKRALDMREDASEAMGDLRTKLETLRAQRLDEDRKLDASRRAS